MTTYTETVTNNNQLFDLHAKLRAKHFEQTADAYWTEIWENQNTEEKIIINRIEK